jgi:CubicO group peptidase (beta-lactamase class C family)
LILNDPVLTEQMTIRDLITHRSGLPRHDMVWYSADFSREDIIRRLQYLEPNKPLRSTFQYNNLMFMTAGYIAGLLNGKSWEDTIRERILSPLGMNGTNFSLKDSQSSPDFALPYRKGNDVKADVKRIALAASGEMPPVSSTIRFRSRRMNLALTTIPPGNSCSPPTIVSLELEVGYFSVVGLVKISVLLLTLVIANCWGTPAPHVSAPVVRTPPFPQKTATKSGALFLTVFQMASPTPSASTRRWSSR